MTEIEAQHLQTLLQLDIFGGYHFHRKIDVANAESIGIEGLPFSCDAAIVQWQERAIFF